MFLYFILLQEFFICVHIFQKTLHCLNYIIPFVQRFLTWDTLQACWGYAKITCAIAGVSNMVSKVAKTLDLKMYFLSIYNFVNVFIILSILKVSDQIIFTTNFLNLI